MQRDQMTGMDLTSDPERGDPSPAAKIVPFKRRRRPAAADLDLTDQVPSDSATVEVGRTTQDSSTLKWELRIWRLAHFVFHYNVHGRLSWAPPLCALVLFQAIAAAVLVPSLVLDPAASDSLRIAVMAGVGGVVLATSAGLLTYWIGKKP